MTRNDPEVRGAPPCFESTGTKLRCSAAETVVTEAMNKWARNSSRAVERAVEQRRRIAGGSWSDVGIASHRSHARTNLMALKKIAERPQARVQRQPAAARATVAGTKAGRSRDSFGRMCWRRISITTYLTVKCQGAYSND
jgi:hypothetical protein